MKNLQFIATLTEGLQTNEALKHAAGAGAELLHLQAGQLLQTVLQQLLLHNIGQQKQVEKESGAGFKHQSVK